MAQQKVSLSVTTVFVLLAASGCLSFILVDVLEPIHSMASMGLRDFEPSLTDKRAELLAWLNQQQTSCPETENPLGDVIISSCPWENVQHTDHSRRPATITKAVCQCSDCLNFKSGNRSNAYGTCREIIRPMKVLRRVRDLNETRGFHYMMDVELVPVGCSCSTIDPLFNRTRHES